MTVWKPVAHAAALPPVATNRLWLVRGVAGDKLSFRHARPRADRARGHASNTRSLLPPLHRKPLAQHVHPEVRRLPPVHDRLYDIRRQQRQHQDAPEVAAVQLLRCRKRVPERVNNNETAGRRD